MVWKGDGRTPFSSQLSDSEIRVRKDWRTKNSPWDSPWVILAWADTCAVCSQCSASPSLFLLTFPPSHLPRYPSLPMHIDPGPSVIQFAFPIGGMLAMSGPPRPIGPSLLSNAGAWTRPVETSRPIDVLQLRPAPIPGNDRGLQASQMQQRPLKAGLIDKLFNMVTMLNDERLLIKS